MKEDRRQRDDSGGRRTGDVHHFQRRKGRHLQEIPDPELHPVRYRMLQLRWRMAVAAVVYPVQIALAVALAVCTVPVYLVLAQQSDLHRSNAALKVQQVQVRELVGRIQDSRVHVTKDLCKQLDRNARTINSQLRLYQGIIVNGAKQSRVFESFFRQFGAPPYAVRLREAELSARRIEKLKLPLPNCSLAITRVQNPRGLNGRVHP
jgi:hypothetical protein